MYLSFRSRADNPHGLADDFPRRCRPARETVFHAPLRVEAEL
jgi:hypothetical protein